MDRFTAKSRLSDIRKEIDTRRKELNGLVDRLVNNEISTDECTVRENELRSELDAFNKEFKTISSLPCCNI